MTTAVAAPVRWAGLSAIGAGLIFAAIQPIHPPDTLASVGTTAWAFIQSLKLAMCVLFLLGVAGLYARQQRKTGWLGLAGFLALFVSWVLQAGFVFTSALVLPQVAATAPDFVAGFLGIASGAATTGIGMLPQLYLAVGLLYLLGGVLFGVATFRARVLPRAAGALLALGAVLPLLFSTVVSHPYDRYFAIPVALAFVWMGYALFTESRRQVIETTTGPATPAFTPRAS